MNPEAPAQNSEQVPRGSVTEKAGEHMSVIGTLEKIVSMFTADARANTIVELDDDDPPPQWLVMVPSNVVRGHQNYLPVAFLSNQKEAEDLRRAIRGTAFDEHPEWTIGSGCID
jgi:hypothetical protein